jgi:hypothetical protein
VSEVATVTTERVYEASHTKRRRRTKNEMEQFRLALHDIVADVQPCSVRQVYYIGIGRLYEKGDPAYNSVIRELGILRERGDLPCEWISDHTRLRRIDTMYDSVQDALARTAEHYRRDLWSRQPRRVEVWCESDSIGGVLNEVTQPLGVALLAARGQSSKTFVYDSAQEYKRIGKPVTVLYVGDWDPSGLAIDRSVRERLDRYGDESVLMDFRRIAVTPDQIRLLDLVSHEANPKDTNYRRFVDACNAAGLPTESSAVEVEAIPPPVLRDLLESEIYALVEDADTWNVTIAAEESERAIFAELAGDRWSR